MAIINVELCVSSEFVSLSESSWFDPACPAGRPRSSVPVCEGWWCCIETILAHCPLHILVTGLQWCRTFKHLCGPASDGLLLQVKYRLTLVPCPRGRRLSLRWIQDIFIQQKWWYCENSLINKNLRAQSFSGWTSHTWKTMSELLTDPRSADLN